MVEEFRGKTAIVTGGASGLGAALVRELAASGARIIIADINLAGARAIGDSLGSTVEAVYVDVSDANQIERLVKETKARYGAIDLMINDAGVSAHGDSLSLPFAEWQRVLSINLQGVIAGSLAAYPVMAEQGFGHIVNIGSLAGLTYEPLFGPYVTSKSAVIGFSRVLAYEAEVHGVHVSLVCSGNIRTPILDQCEPSRYTPAMPADKAAHRILRAVARKKRIIVFPFYARLYWWIERIHPDLLNPARREILRRARKRREQQTTNA